MKKAFVACLLLAGLLLVVLSLRKPGSVTAVTGAVPPAAAPVVAASAPVSAPAPAPAPAPAATLPGRGSVVQAAAVGSIPMLPSVAMREDWSGFNPDSITVLLEGVPLVFQRQSAEYRYHRQQWVGRLPNDPLSAYVATGDAHGNYFVNINTTVGTYTIKVHEGQATVYFTDAATACSGSLKPTPAMLAENEAAQASQTSAAGSGVAKALSTAAATTYTCDILECLDQTAFARFCGSDPNQALTQILTFYAVANTEMQNSHVTNFSWALHYLYIVPSSVFTEAGNMNTDLPQLATSSTTLGARVSSLLGSTGSDAVNLLVANGANYAGLAYVSSRYSEVEFDYAGSRVLSHELGHNLGLLHDRITEGTVGTDQTHANYGYMFRDPVYGYSIGYSLTLSLSSYPYTGDIMSYASNRLPYYSTPANSYSGTAGTWVINTPMGFALGQVDPADAVTTVLANVSRMAGYAVRLTGFILEPQSMVLSPGASTNLVAVYDDNNATYQWYKNGTAISGATSDSYTITGVSGPSNTYYCVATSNGVNHACQTATISSSGSTIPQVGLTFGYSPTTVTCGSSVYLYTTGGSGSGAVTFALNSGNGTLSGSYFTPSTVGTVSIQATKAGDSTYDSATVSGSFTVGKGAASFSGYLTYPSTLYPGKTYSPSSVPKATNGSLRYSSLSPTVATVDAGTGAITCLSSGTVSIQVTLSYDSANYSAAVTSATTPLYVSPALTQATVSGSLVYGTFFVDSAAAAPSTVPTAVNGTLSYSSSDTSVATVDASTGLLTPLKMGQVVVTAKLTANAGSEVSGTGTVTATVPVYSHTPASLSGSLVYPSIKVGAVAISPTKTPLATNGSVTYASSNTAVATVNASSGAVNVLSLGSATITASLSPSIGYQGSGSVSAVLDLYIANDSHLVNISTRSLVKNGDAVQIAGFVISGSGSKQVLIRASGPALTQWGLAAVSDPVLTLYNSQGTALATNDDWDSATIATVANSLGAFAWIAGSKDAALLVTLQPGSYTTIVQDKAGGTGISLVEVYDATPSLKAARLSNISTRSVASTDTNTQIAGFVISGSSSKKVLIRAGGPALGKLGLSGYLSDPVLSLYSSAGAVLATNNDWDSKYADLAAAVGGFAYTAGSKDALIAIKLEPGTYTAMVTPNTGTSDGIALIEVYEIPDELSLP